MAKRRFTSEKNARAFAKKINGEFKDLRDIPGSISKFVVKYNGTPKTKKFWDSDQSNDWSPEEGRDFGYPNEYWK